MAFCFCSFLFLFYQLLIKCGTSGGLLCTADGELPPNIEELWPLLRSAGIEPWELFTVDNSMSPGAIEAGPPPLDFFRKDVMLQKEKNKSGKND